VETVRWKRLHIAKDAGRRERLTLQLNANESRHAIGLHRPSKATRDSAMAECHPGTPDEVVVMRQCPRLVIPYDMPVRPSSLPNTDSRRGGLPSIVCEWMGDLAISVSNEAASCPWSLGGSYNAQTSSLRATQARPKTSSRKRFCESYATTVSWLNSGMRGLG
jgi:hypothetical protein